MEQALTDYSRAVAYLLGHTDYERMSRIRYHTRSFNLGRMQRLCELLGQPQDKFASLHVAGTKGKGSVTAMTAAMLAGSGRRIGQYTSPHLVDLRERICTLATNRAPQPGSPLAEPISEADFVAALNAVAAAAAKMQDDPPTFFELVTATGFVHFANSGVELAVLETGLGGRLDATNVVVPRAAALTPIGIEHTLQLGTTIEQIAGEKAGIIKPGVPAVSAPQPPEAEAVIRRAAAERMAPLWFVGREVHMDRRLVEDGFPRRWEVTVRTPGRTFGPLAVPLLGRHQTVNLAVALGLLDHAISAGFEVSPEQAADGLARTVWRGRLQVVARRPWVVLDGAHTPDSIRAVLETLAETFNYRRLIVVLSCLADKDIDGIVGALSGAAEEAVLTRSDHPHAAEPEVLATAMTRLSPLTDRHVEPDAAAALELGRRLGGANDLVLVTGSIYLAGLLLRHQVRGGVRGPL